MKVIDLLNKIANGEVPIKVVYHGFLYRVKDNNYYSKDIDEYLISDLRILDEEIEIIEDAPQEEKKIPEKLKLYAPYPECEDHRFDVVEAKINEIIEYLESKEK